MPVSCAISLDEESPRALYVPAPISAAADRFAALYPILWLTPPVQLYWAARSHFIENYLVDTVDEFRGRLVLLVNTCYNSMPQ